LVADGIVGAKTRAALVGTSTEALCPNGMTLASNCSKAPSTTPTATEALCPNGMTLASNCTTAPTGTTTTVTGGAGDADVAHYATGEKSKIVEGDSDIKALGFKIEAIDSDISVSNVKVMIENTGDADTATKITKYLDSVDIYKGTTKVGSADASDFSKESGTNEYTKTISISDAIVKEGDKDPFYVMLNANDTIDSENLDAVLTVSLESFRFQDGTGVVFSNSDVPATVTNDVNVDDSSTNDNADIKSSSENPDDSTVTVDENDTTNDVLAMAFKIDVDDDSSDITLNELPITLTIADETVAGTNDFAEKVIDSVNVKIDGTEYEAELTTDGTTAAADGGDVLYTADLEDEDVVLSGGDVKDVKVYVTFAENTSGTAYAENTTVQAKLDVSAIKAETDNDDTFAFDGADRTGAVLTLNTTGATVSGQKWSVNSTGTIVDFFFTVEADTDDFDVLASSVTNTIAGTMVTLNTTGLPETAAPGYGVLSRYSGDSVVTLGGVGTETGFTVAEGDTTTFRIRYSVGSTTAVAAVAADNGKWLEVTISSVAGQAVDEDTQTSPTATVNL